MIVIELQKAEERKIFVGFWNRCLQAFGKVCTSLCHIIKNIEIHERNNV